MTKSEAQSERFETTICHLGIRTWFVIRDSSFVIKLAALLHQVLPAKNGLCCFSSPTVVIGPCPGQMIVSSRNVRIFSRLFRNAALYDTLPPPIDPAKSESPTIAIGRASPVTTYVTP